jgi:hypothetical protein
MDRLAGIRKALLYAGLFAVFGPFAFAYLFGFAGLDLPNDGMFAIWFMSAFSILGIYGSVAFALDSWRNSRRGHRSEWGLVIAFIAFTAFLINVTIKTFAKSGLI